MSYAEKKTVIKIETKTTNDNFINLKFYLHFHNS